MLLDKHHEVNQRDRQDRYNSLLRSHATEEKTFGRIKRPVTNEPSMGDLLRWENEEEKKWDFKNKNRHYLKQAEPYDLMRSRINKSGSQWVSESKDNYRSLHPPKDVERQLYDEYQAHGGEITPDRLGMKDPQFFSYGDPNQFKSKYRDDYNVKDVKTLRQLQKELVSNELEDQLEKKSVTFGPPRNEQKKLERSLSKLKNSKATDDYYDLNQNYVPGDFPPRSGLPGYMQPPVRGPEHSLVPGGTLGEPFPPRHFDDSYIPDRRHSLDHSPRHSYDSHHHHGPRFYDDNIINYGSRYRNRSMPRPVYHPHHKHPHHSHHMYYYNRDDPSNPRVKAKQSRERVKKFWAETRFLPNSSTQTYMGKPAFECYGRGNTTPATGGLVYGKYLLTHNVNPQRYPNTPKKRQVYKSAERTAEMAPPKEPVVPRKPIYQDLEQNDKSIRRQLKRNKIDPERVHEYQPPYPRPDLANSIRLHGRTQRPKYPDDDSSSSDEDSFDRVNHRGHSHARGLRGYLRGSNRFPPHVNDPFGADPVYSPGHLKDRVYQRGEDPFYADNYYGSTTRPHSNIRRAPNFPHYADTSDSFLRNRSNYNSGRFPRDVYDDPLYRDDFDPRAYDYDYDPANPFRKGGPHQYRDPYVRNKETMPNLDKIRQGVAQPDSIPKPDPLNPLTLGEKKHFDPVSKLPLSAQSFGEPIPVTVAGETMLGRQVRTPNLFTKEELDPKNYKNIPAFWMKRIPPAGKAA